MSVGFHLAYRRNDVTYMALGVARRLHALGLDVSILPSERPEPVHPFWDRYAARGRQTYWDWIRKGRFSHVIFGNAPNHEALQAAKSGGSSCYLLALWDELTDADVSMLPQLDRVVCPHRAVARLLESQLELTNLHIVPWDPGAPITRDARRVDPDRIGVYWPIPAGGNRQEPEVAAMLGDVLACNPSLYLTVSHPAGAPASLARELRRLAGLERVELYRNLSWEREQLLYGRHDITVWPALADGLGLVGLSSIYMGTPVVAFDHPLVGDVIKDGRNGLLVPCELGYNWLNVPRVEAPNYRTFGENLLTLVGDPERLDRLRETTPIGLRQRRVAYHATLDALFA